jgi:hypothetical protein
VNGCDARPGGRKTDSDVYGYCYLQAGHTGPHMDESLRTGASYEFATTVEQLDMMLGRSDS